MKTSLTLFLFLIISTFTNAQIKDELLAQFLTKDKQLLLPTTAGNFTSKLGFEPNIKDDPNTRRGFYFSWLVEEAVEITFVELKDNNQYVGFSCFSDDEIGGLPYGFTFNKSTLQETLVKFKDQKPTQKSVEDGENSHVKLSLKLKNRFVYLFFYGKKSILRAMTISSTELR